MSQGRWAYMSAPGFNPPNSACCDAGAGCDELSRSYLIGTKGIFSDGALVASRTRWKCEHGHQWTKDEGIP